MEQDETQAGTTRGTPTGTPTASFYEQKAKTIREHLGARYAVPADVMDALEEANGREGLERVRLKLGTLRIGSFAHEQVAEALAELLAELTGRSR